MKDDDATNEKSHSFEPTGACASSYVQTNNIDDSPLSHYPKGDSLSTVAMDSKETKRLLQPFRNGRPGGGYQYQSILHEDDGDDAEDPALSSLVQRKEFDNTDYPAPLLLTRDGLVRSKWLCGFVIVLVLGVFSSWGVFTRRGADHVEQNSINTRSHDHYSSVAAGLTVELLGQSNSRTDSDKGKKNGKIVVVQVVKVHFPKNSNTEDDDDDDSNPQEAEEEEQDDSKGSRNNAGGDSNNHDWKYYRDKYAQRQQNESQTESKKQQGNNKAGHGVEQNNQHDHSTRTEQKNDQEEGSQQHQKHSNGEQYDRDGNLSNKNTDKQVPSSSPMSESKSIENGSRLDEKKTRSSSNKESSNSALKSSYNDVQDNIASESSDGGGYDWKKWAGKYKQGGNVDPSSDQVSSTIVPTGAPTTTTDSRLSMNSGSIDDVSYVDVDASCDEAFLRPGFHNYILEQIIVHTIADNVDLDDVRQIGPNLFEENDQNGQVIMYVEYDDENDTADMVLVRGFNLFNSYREHYDFVPLSKIDISDESTSGRPILEKEEHSPTSSSSPAGCRIIRSFHAGLVSPGIIGDVTPNQWMADHDDDMRTFKHIMDSYHASHTGTLDQSQTAGTTNIATTDPMQRLTNRPATPAGFFPDSNPAVDSSTTLTGTVSSSTSSPDIVDKSSAALGRTTANNPATVEYTSQPNIFLSASPSISPSPLINSTPSPLSMPTRFRPTRAPATSSLPPSTNPFVIPSENPSMSAIPSKTATMSPRTKTLTTTSNTFPTTGQSANPTTSPSTFSTTNPTKRLTVTQRTTSPTPMPSTPSPSMVPTTPPSTSPTTEPTSTTSPSTRPTAMPSTTVPSMGPTEPPTTSPTTNPTTQPTASPTIIPTTFPTTRPTMVPSSTSPPTMGQLAIARGQLVREKKTKRRKRTS